MSTTEPQSLRLGVLAVVTGARKSLAGICAAADVAISHTKTLLGSSHHTETEAAVPAFTGDTSSTQVPQVSVVPGVVTTGSQETPATPPLPSSLSSTRNSAPRTRSSGGSASGTLFPA